MGGERAGRSSTPNGVRSLLLQRPQWAQLKYVQSSASQKCTSSHTYTIARPQQSRSNVPNDLAPPNSGPGPFTQRVSAPWTMWRLTIGCWCPSRNWPIYSHRNPRPHPFLHSASRPHAQRTMVTASSPPPLLLPHLNQNPRCPLLPLLSKASPPNSPTSSSHTSAPPTWPTPPVCRAPGDTSQTTTISGVASSGHLPASPEVITSVKPPGVPPAHITQRRLHSRRHPPPCSSCPKTDFSWRACLPRLPLVPLCFDRAMWSWCAP